MCVGILFFGVKLSFTHSHNYFVFWGKCKCWTVCFLCFWATTSSSVNCFWTIQVSLIRSSWCDLMQADLPVWTDSAGWEVLTVLDDWKMMLLTLLVEAERVKMVVVC